MTLLVLIGAFTLGFAFLLGCYLGDYFAKVDAKCILDERKEHLRNTCGHLYDLCLELDRIPDANWTSQQIVERLLPIYRFGQMTADDLAKGQAARMRDLQNFVRGTHGV